MSKGALALIALGGAGYLAYRAARKDSGARVTRRRPPVNYDLHPVRSSMIREIGYTTPKRQMHVRFNTGNVYGFSDVPVDVYSGLLKADSKGTYFNENVRDKYEHKKMAAVIPLVTQRLDHSPRRKPLREVMQDLRKLDTVNEYERYVTHDKWLDRPAEERKLAIGRHHAHSRRGDRR
ncbi:MAG: KTSC domain-containing protein [Candidatus Limnocylindrus sp.]